VIEEVRKCETELRRLGTNTGIESLSIEEWSALEPTGVYVSLTLAQLRSLGREPVGRARPQG
jgi:hypothetical protein